MRPFVSAKTFPVSVCNKFMQGLDPRILSYFEGFYPQHNEPHELDSHIQRERLNQIYMAAIKAENAYNVTTAAARDAVGAAPQSYCATVPALPSQAENTLRRYDTASPVSSPSSSPARARGKCFGCKSTSHLWMDKKGNIICPKKDDPAIRETADAAHTAWLKDQAHKRRGKRRDIDYDSLSDKIKGSCGSRYMHPMPRASPLPSPRPRPLSMALLPLSNLPTHSHACTKLSCSTSLRTLRASIAAPPRGARFQHQLTLPYPT